MVVGKISTDMKAEFSIVDIATCYGLVGSGIESLVGTDFLFSSRLSLGSTKPPVQYVSGLFSGIIATGVWC
jgi:hypothetical protein